MSISLSKLQAALPLTQEVDAALDVDGNGVVSYDEPARIGIRDGWAARDLFERAESWAAPEDGSPRPSEIDATLAASARALAKLDKNKDGTLSDAELAHASKIGKALVAFADKDGGLTLADMKIRPYEKPGTPEFAALTRRTYADNLTNSTVPFFGTALIVPRSKQPAGVQKLYDQVAKGAGDTNCADWLVNGELTYFMQRVDKASGTGAAAVCDAKGNVLGEGTIRQVTADKPWRVSWS